jgi:hypothetical protein
MSTYMTLRQFTSTKCTCIAHSSSERMQLFCNISTCCTCTQSGCINKCSSSRAAFVRPVTLPLLHQNKRGMFAQCSVELRVLAAVCLRFVSQSCCSMLRNRIEREWVQFAASLARNVLTSIHWMCTANISERICVSVGDVTKILILVCIFFSTSRHFAIHGHGLRQTQTLQRCTYFTR